jgi:hypothetical protein
MPNKKQLLSFTEYCFKHPEERFWQALRNWSGHDFIYASNVPPDQIELTPQPQNYLEDTFYYQKENK